MRVIHEPWSFSVAGVVHTRYIRKVKRHWWSRWEIVMDGPVPQFYDCVDVKIKKVKTMAFIKKNNSHQIGDLVVTTKQHESMFL